MKCKNTNVKTELKISIRTQDKYFLVCSLKWHRNNVTLGSNKHSLKFRSHSST